MPTNSGTDEITDKQTAETCNRISALEPSVEITSGERWRGKGLKAKLVLSSLFDIISELIKISVPRT